MIPWTGCHDTLRLYGQPVVGERERLGAWIGLVTGSPPNLEVARSIATCARTSDTAWLDPDVRVNWHKAEIILLPRRAEHVRHGRSGTPCTRAHPRAEVEEASSTLNVRVEPSSECRL